MGSILQAASGARRVDGVAQGVASGTAEGATPHRPSSDSQPDAVQCCYSASGQATDARFVDSWETESADWDSGDWGWDSQTRNCFAWP